MTGMDETALLKKAEGDLRSEYEADADRLEGLGADAEVFSELATEYNDRLRWLRSEKGRAFLLEQAGRGMEVRVPTQA